MLSLLVGLVCVAVAAIISLWAVASGKVTVPSVMRQLLIAIALGDVCILTLLIAINYLALALTSIAVLGVAMTVVISLWVSR